MSHQTDVNHCDINNNMSKFKQPHSFGGINQSQPMRCRQRGSTDVDFLPYYGNFSHGSSISPHLQPIAISSSKVKGYREVCVTVDGAPKINVKFQVHLQTSVATLIRKVKRRVGVNLNRGARILVNDSTLNTKEPVLAQLPIADVALTLDLKLSVLVFDSANLFLPPNGKENLKTMKERTKLSIEDSPPYNFVSCFSSDSARCLMKSGDDFSRQRVMEADSFRLIHENMNVRDLLEDDDILQTESVTVLLERKISVTIQDNVLQNMKTLMVWPSQKIKSLLGSCGNVITYCEQIIDIENTFSEARIVSGSLLLVSNTILLKVHDSNSQCYSLQVEGHKTLKEVREDLKKIKNNSNIKVRLGDHEVVCDSRPVSCLAANGTVNLKIFYRRRNVQVSWGSQTHTLPNVNENTQYAELLQMVGEVFNGVLPSGYVMQCSCGRIVTNYNGTRHTFPIQCCDNETLDLTIVFPFERSQKICQGCESHKPNITRSLSTIAGRPNLSEDPRFSSKFISFLISTMGDVNYKDSLGQSVLHFVAQTGEVEVAQVLLDLGADVNTKRSDELTPLHVAAVYGHACLVRLLLDHSDDVDKETPDGKTPLHLAVQGGSLDTVRLLVNCQADVNRTTRKGLSPLHIASFEGHTEIIRLLLSVGNNQGKKVFDKDVKTPKGKTALHLAATKGRLSVVHALIEVGCDLNSLTSNGFTPLHLAVDAGHLEVAKCLIDSRCNINSKTRFGTTALHLAILKRRLDVARLLIHSKCDVNLASKYGTTALHLTVIQNQLEMAQLLIDCGCDVDFGNKCGKTALHLAAEIGHFAFVQLLLGSCCNVKAMTTNGRTAKALAAAKGHFKVATILHEYEYM